MEVDVFENENSGLIIVEIELDSMSDKFITPNWIGEEITNQREYSNYELSKNPVTLRDSKLITNVTNEVRKVVAAHLNDYKIDLLKNDEDLRYRGLDSLDIVEIIMYLEDTYGVEIETDKLRGINTIDMLVDVTNDAIHNSRK